MYNIPSAFHSKTEDISIFQLFDKHKMFGLCLVWLFLLQFFTTYPLYAQIVIGDEDISRNEILSTNPLIGYRKLSPELFKCDGERTVGIPVDVFIESAKVTQLVKDRLLKEGIDPSKATLNDWYMATRPTNSTTSQEHISKPTTINLYSAAYDNMIVDPMLVSSLPKTEIFKSDEVLTYTTHVGGKEVECIKADPTAFASFADSYCALAEAEGMEPTHAQHSFEYASDIMASYPLLREAAEFEAGQVSFGKPVIFSSNEKKLVIPESITSKGDVYWTTLALSFYDIEINDIEELIFVVTAPPEIFALELIPLRFDKEMNVTRIISSPEIKVKFGANVVELGKVYEQQVVYKSLKPTIVAYGLQENKFSWSMVDEAIQLGSKRFVALIQVPKGRESLTLELQASAKTKPGWIAQGNIIATGSDEGSHL